MRSAGLKRWKSSEKSWMQRFDLMKSTPSVRKSMKLAGLKNRILADSKSSWALIDLRKAILFGKSSSIRIDLPSLTSFVGLRRSVVSEKSST